VPRFFNSEAVIFMHLKKNRFLRVLSISIAVLIWYIPGYGGLRYQVLQAADAPIKIGFIFPNTNDKLSTFLNKNLQDLNSTGELDAFYLSSNSSQLKDSTFRHSCKAQSIDYIVQFSIKSISKNRTQVYTKCIRLGDKSAQDKTLFENTQLITNKGISYFAHLINDKIYQALMGHTGLFLTRIAFVTKEKIGSQEIQYQLKIANFDGSNEQTLDTANKPIFSLAASPSGNVIAYTAFNAGRASIYFYNLKSGKKTQMTHFSAIDNAPAFSPDGQQLAFTAEKNKKINLFLMDIHTHQIKQLTHGYAIDTEPAFSTNGHSLIFTSDRDGSPQLYEYIFATQKIIRLTYQGNYNAHASFAENDQSIIFTHKKSGVCGISKINRRSKAITMLTATGKDQSPTISPNGQMILYTTTDDKHREALGLISLTSHIRARLTADQVNLQAPIWIPPQNMDGRN